MHPYTNIQKCNREFCFSVCFSLYSHELHVFISFVPPPQNFFFLIQNLNTVIIIIISPPKLNSAFFKPAMLTSLHGQLPGCGVRLPILTINYTCNKNTAVFSSYEQFEFKKNCWIHYFWIGLDELLHNELNNASRRAVRLCVLYH